MKSESSKTACVQILELLADHVLSAIVYALEILSGRTYCIAEAVFRPLTLNVALVHHRPSVVHNHPVNSVIDQMAIVSPAAEPES